MPDVDDEERGVVIDNQITSRKTRKSSQAKHVVILVHGIRDHALWQNEIRKTLEQHGFAVEPTNYGRLSLLRFLLPFPFLRRSASMRVGEQLRMVFTNPEYVDAKVSVIAHSFGTKIVSELMRRHFDIRFHRMIFCGSVVRYSFDFERLRDRFSEPVLNEVGAGDVFPALAESVAWGYGSGGTYGFHRPLVRDRWHNDAGHSYFLSREFCEKYWIPFLRSGVTPDDDQQATAPALWVRIASLLNIKVLVPGLLVAWLVVSIAPFVSFRFIYEKKVPTYVEVDDNWGSTWEYGADTAQFSEGKLKALSRSVFRIQVSDDVGAKFATAFAVSSNQLLTSGLALDGRPLDHAVVITDARGKAILKASHVEVRDAGGSGRKFLYLTFPTNTFVAYPIDYSDSAITVGDRVRMVGRHKEEWSRQLRAVVQSFTKDVIFLDGIAQGNYLVGAPLFNRNGAIVGMVEGSVDDGYGAALRLPAPANQTPASPVVQGSTDQPDK